MRTFDLYRRYKIGTKHVVQWLVDTARTCNSQSSNTILLDRLTIGSPAKTSGGAKVKKHEVAISELPELAERVVQGAQASSLPLKGLRDVLIVLEDVISGRRECAVWYQTSDKADQIATSEAQRTSHLHIIDVLSDVLQRLRRASHACTPKQDNDTNTSSTTAKVENVYSSLCLEELGNDPLASVISPASVTKTSTKKQPKPVEVQCGVEEGDFALWCFLKDCQELQSSIRAAWSQYSDGQISLITVSQLTDVAMVLLEHASQVFAEQFPHLGDFGKIADHLQLRMSMLNQEVESFSSKKGPFAAQGASDGGGSFSLLCIPALTTLHILGKWIASRDMARDEQNSAFLHIATGCIGRVGCSIAAIIPELQILAVDKARRDHVAGCDRFTRMLCAFAVDPTRMPLHLVVAIQTHMQIQDPGLRVDKAFESAMRSMDRSKRRLDEVYEYMDEMLPSASKYTNVLDSPLRKAIQSCLEGDVVAVRSWYASGAEEWDMTTRPRSYLALPLVCISCAAGHLAGAVRDAQLTDSIEMCNNAGMIVIATAHLYHACLASGLLTERWDDLDFVLEQQGKDAFGLKDLSSTKTPLLLAAKWYGVALGVKLGRYDKNCKKVPLPSFADSLKRMPKMRAPSAVGGPCLAASSEDTDITDTWTIRSRLYNIAQRVSDKREASMVEPIRNPRNVKQTFSNARLLDSLRTHLVDEETHSTFGYYGFLFTCALILGLVRDRYTYLEPGKTKGLVLYEMASDLLWNSTKNEDQGAMVLPGIQIFANVLSKCIHVRPVLRDSQLQNARVGTSGFLTGVDVPMRLVPIKPNQALMRAFNLRRSLEGSNFTMEDANLDERMAPVIKHIQETLADKKYDGATPEERRQAIDEALLSVGFPPSDRYREEGFDSGIGRAMRSA